MIAENIGYTLGMYEKIARYYDLSHATLTADIGFVLTLASQANGPILELGCGTGRLLLPLARAGYTVTGLDNSPAMLAYAQRHLGHETEAVQHRVTLVEADMTTFTLAGQESHFALAILPYNTLMHLEPGQAPAVFQRIGRYLRADGRLFIDLTNPFTVAQTVNDGALSLENSLVEPETGDIVLQMASNWLDDKEQVLRITWIYDTTPPTGGLIHRTVVQAAYHYLYPHQLELFLADAGFTLESLSGNYNQAPFSEESERMLILAGLR
jgi:SAM-dependent methyltransferase